MAAFPSSSPVPIRIIRNRSFWKYLSPKCVFLIEHKNPLCHYLKLKKEKTPQKIFVYGHVFVENTV